MKGNTHGPDTFFLEKYFSAASLCNQETNNIMNNLSQVT